MRRDVFVRWVTWAVFALYIVAAGHEVGLLLSLTPHHQDECGLCVLLFASSLWFVLLVAVVPKFGELHQHILECAPLFSRQIRLPESHRGPPLPCLSYLS